MTFRDDREREAWERTYDAAIRATFGRSDAIEYADAKIVAMREREDKPEPEATVRGERERLEELLNRLTGHSWTPHGNYHQVVDKWAVADLFQKALAAIPPEPAPEPSQRGALERLLHRMRGHVHMDKGVPVVDLVSLESEIQDELSRQPPDDRAEVDALIEAARDLMVMPGNDPALEKARGTVLRLRLAALDRVRGGGA